MSSQGSSITKSKRITSLTLFIYIRYHSVRLSFSWSTFSTSADIISIIFCSVASHQNLVKPFLTEAFFKVNVTIGYILSLGLRKNCRTTYNHESYQESTGLVQCMAPLVATVLYGQVE